MRREFSLEVSLVLTFAAALLILAAEAEAEPQPVQHATWNSKSLIFGHAVERDLFHFHISFGIGGGPDNEGLFHAMEIGGTFDNGVVLALLHTFVQNKDVLGPDRGPDLLGGWMLEVKVPVFAPEFEVKVAGGFGGLHDQSDGGLRVIPGFGVAYGIDFNLPFARSSGLTLGLTLLHVWVPTHYFAASVGLGYTFF